MKRHIIIMLFLLMFIGVAGFTAYADIPAGYYEGGMYIDDPMSTQTTLNFLNNFTYELNYATNASNWTTSNDSSPYGVDWYDFAYFCGHGYPYNIMMYGGDYVDLRNAGNNNNSGYGLYLKYLVLHSCQTVPSPIDIADPWTPWLGEPGGIFDGLHVLCGFRTNAGKSSGLNIASYMGNLTYNHSNTVVNNWINAVDTYGNSDGTDEYCLFSAFRDGYLDNPTYDSWYDVYGVSASENTVDPNLWCVWSE